MTHTDKTLFSWITRSTLVLVATCLVWLVAEYIRWPTFQIYLLCVLCWCSREPVPVAAILSTVQQRLATSYYMKRFIINVAACISFVLLVVFKQWFVFGIILLLIWVDEFEFMTNGTTDNVVTSRVMLIRTTIVYLLMGFGLVGTYVGAYLHHSDQVRAYFWWWSVVYASGRHAVRIAVRTLSRRTGLYSPLLVLYSCVSLDVPLLLALFAHPNLNNVVMSMATICMVDASFGTTTMFSDGSAFISTRIWLVAICSVIAPIAGSPLPSENPTMTSVIPRLYIGILSVALAAWFPLLLDATLVMMDKCVPSALGAVAYQPLAHVNNGLFGSFITPVDNSECSIYNDDLDIFARPDNTNEYMRTSVTNAFTTTSINMPDVAPFNIEQFDEFSLMARYGFWNASAASRKCYRTPHTHIHHVVREIMFAVLGVWAINVAMRGNI